MTTEIVSVPRDELSELLQDGVDDYWITSESGVRIVKTLRALLAQPVASEPVADKLQELGFLEGWLRFAAEPIGQECCGRGLNGECCGCPDPVYPDIEHVGLAMDDRAKELRAQLAAAPQPTEGSTDE